MNDGSKTRLIRISIASIAILFIGIIIYAVINLMSHAGMHQVTIKVLPEGSTVTIDGEPAQLPTAWVTDGTHIFSATKDGFGDDSATLSITEDQTIALLPAPESEEAIAWATEQENALAIDSLGTIAAQNRGSTLVDINPVIEALPHADISGPYSIDYGYTGEGDTQIYLIIHNSTPNGRQKALQWIRDQGFDPIELDIRFSDFINPLYSDGI